MRLKFKHLLLGIIMCCTTGLTYSQDIQLSQFDAAPLFFNPALSGNYDGIHRFIGNYKGQWRTWNTGLFSYDRMLPEKWTFGGGKFGIGGMVSWDRGGEINYGNTQYMLIPSYHIPIIPNDVLFLSAGVNVNFTQNSLDNSKVITGNNIDKNTGLETPGSTYTERMNFFDFSAGINAYSLVDSAYPINVGITLHHLAKPGKSPINGTNIQNARRMSINANTVIPLTKMFAFLPSLVWMNQKPSNQVNAGTYFRISLAKVPYAFYVGSWWRIGDAAILGAAVDFPGFNKETHVVNVGFSYDITASSFNESAKNDRSKVSPGSVEFSIKYIIKRAKFKWTPPTKLNPVNF